MRFILGAIVAIVAIVLAAIPVSVNAANQTSNGTTNNFRITNFDIQYELSQDDSQRSVLKTTETITAKFPTYNQNHGLERALPAEYDGHSTGLVIDSITDTAGNALEYSVAYQGDMQIFRIGNKDKYVLGEQVYKITYTQHDVTRFFTNNGRDEWYWDTNGTNWKVPIDSLTITAKISSGLISKREGEVGCYRGFGGSTGKCIPTPTGENRAYR